jgi:hypothetical protein
VDSIEEEEGKEKKEKNLSLFELRKRTYVGGELSLLFGNRTYLFIAPIIGYDITPKFSAGVSGMYQFFRSQNPFNGSVATSHAYGGGVFARLRPIKPLLLQTEFNLYNTDDYTTSFVGDRTNVPALMAGLGYAGNMGEGAYYQILLMYDFIDDFNMPLPRLFPNFPVYIKYGFVFHLG